MASNGRSKTIRSEQETRLITAGSFEGEIASYGFVTLESFQSAPGQWEGGNLCPFTSVEFGVLHFVHL